MSYSKRISSSVLPTIFLSNCNHVANKLDELYVLSTDASLQLDIISLTETWLDDFTPDAVCHLPDFNLYRKDRTYALGGGVLCYIHHSINVQIIEPTADANNIDDHYSSSFEVLWLILRPRVLPRPYSQLLVVVV